MYVIKRNGKEVLFDKQKIVVAISKANKEVLDNNLNDDQIMSIANAIETNASKLSRALSIEEIQDMVEKQLVLYGKYEVAKAYFLYRYVHAVDRSNGDLFKKVKAIVSGESEETKQENANKNPDVISVQRDYIAGEVSKAIAASDIYPKYIMDAHNEGIIHKHDLDYAVVHESNCCLVDLEDMLQNGTVISSVGIDKPHSFSTACNITTQIIAQVSSSQFGGQSITLTHLVPFVNISRQAITKQVKEDYIPEDKQEEVINKRLRKEINKGVQIIQYQIITLMTTNGQAPFVTLYMYLNEVETEQEKEDLAMIIEEVLNQRIQGVKNEQGVFITPAFPKLIYVLEEDNIYRDSKYYYLTELAAKCTAKRLVPDYISEKKAIELKYPTEKLLHIKDRRDQWGDEHIWGVNVFKNLTDEECDNLQDIVNNRFNKNYVINEQAKDIINRYNIDIKIIVPKAYTCMGCVDGKSIIKIKDGLSSELEYTFEELWNECSNNLDVKQQHAGDDANLYIDLMDQDLLIKDINKPRYMYTKVLRIIRNTSDKWCKVKLDNNKELVCTQDHPLMTENNGEKYAINLCKEDIILTDAGVSTVDEVSILDINGYSYDVTTSSGTFEVNGINSHNCRSFLTPDYIHYKTYSRFNQGVCTINLADVALSSEKDYDKFWKIFDERLNICKDALMIAHNYLINTPSSVAPILWQFGALSRLNTDESINKLLVDNYSTISLGYSGLYECTKYMTGLSHTDEEAKPFALKVMQHMNDKCNKWREETNISFSLYGTPLESTTYKFAKSLQRRFGIVEGITDRNYTTNSYHVPVFEKIDAFTKLGFEAEFQALSPGGAISYVEVPNMQDNIDAVIAVIQFIYENIMYAELNTKSDYCYDCGYDGEIRIVDDGNGKLVWECPKCGNRDHSRMSTARRVCGYIGSNDFNQGRTQEIKERVLHL